MSERLHASCHCGKVQVTIPAAAVGVPVCHSGNCREMHRNFDAFLAVPRIEVDLRAADAPVWYQSSDAPRRAFCGTCGGRVLKEATAAGRWLISAGLVDGPLGKRIIRSLREQSRPDWYDLPATAS